MNQFGGLLRQYRTRSFDATRRRSLTQEQLGALLGLELATDGYTGAAVSDWERGQSQIPKDHRQVLISLLKVLRAYAGLHSVGEANQLLWAGNYRSLDNHELSKIFPVDLPHLTTSPEPGPERTPSFELPPRASGERYYCLPGREKELERLLNALADARGPTMIALEGLGGVGKTALTAELARRAIQKKLFAGVIGASAKHEVLLDGHIVPVNEPTPDFDGLLNTLAQQLGRWEVALFKPQEKWKALAQALNERNYLLLMDNLETTEDTYALIAHLRTLLHHSRAILTSRKKVPHGLAFAVSVSGLERAEALRFLRAEATQQTVAQILEAPDEKLAEIHSVTGGLPLALKWVVSQARFLELAPVLDQFRLARGNLYAFLFQPSWHQLQATAQRALVYIGQKVMTPVSWEDLLRVQIVNNDQELLEAIRQLVDYSLLEVTTSAGRLRYSIHPLTRYFVTSDLPRIWREQGHALQPQTVP